MDNGVYPSPSLLRPSPTRLEARDQIPKSGVLNVPGCKDGKEKGRLQGRGEGEGERDSEGFL